MVADSSASDGAWISVRDGPPVLCEPRYLPTGDLLLCLSGDQGNGAPGHHWRLAALSLLSRWDSDTRPTDEI